MAWQVAGRRLASFAETEVSSWRQKTRLIHKAFPEESFRENQDCTTTNSGDSTTSGDNLASGVSHVASQAPLMSTLNQICLITALMSKPNQVALMC